MSDVILKLDTRGRLNVGGRVKKNSTKPAALYRLTFGEFGRIILDPVEVVPLGEVSE